MRKAFFFVALCLFLSWPLSAFAASVNVAWDPSPSPDVAGYRFYLIDAATGGSPTLVGTAGLVTTTSLAIPDVQGAAQYCLVATAFDAAGNESPYSNRATKDGTVYIFKDNVPPDTPKDLRIP